MKKFINKISKGSKLALFLEILLLAQIIMYTRAYINRPECNYGNHEDSIFGVERGIYNDQEE